MRDHDGYVSWVERTLQRLGQPLEAGAVVLDFGCGGGETVEAFDRKGYTAFGCDIELERETSLCRRVQLEPYALPFPDAMFDFVGSADVFEHVQDPVTAFAEIRRVLKPRGTSLHAFASRYTPIELHTFVPLATVIQHPAWLRLWALAGVRNPFQKGLGWREVVDRNHRYLTSKTQYLRRGEIIRAAGKSFAHVDFVERHGIPRNAREAPFAPLLRPLPRVYSGTWSRILFLH
jgi:SAM-dependent methyltransferase